MAESIPTALWSRRDTILKAALLIALLPASPAFIAIGLPDGELDVVDVFLIGYGIFGAGLYYIVHLFVGIDVLLESVIQSLSWFIAAFVIEPLALVLTPGVFAAVIVGTGIGLMSAAVYKMELAYGE